jgi:hypothetical protein
MNYPSGICCRCFAGDLDRFIKETSTTNDNNAARWKVSDLDLDEIVKEEEDPDEVIILEDD